MKKQTAVEWFEDQVGHTCMMALKEFYEIFEKAKEMEKEQICDAYYYGIDVDSWNVDNPYEAAEQYYNETYESKTNI
jgi:hypothetical protein